MIIWSCFCHVICEQLELLLLGFFITAPRESPNQCSLQKRNAVVWPMSTHVAWQTNDCVLKESCQAPLAGKPKTRKRKTLEGLKLPPEPVLGSLPSLPRLSPALALSVYPQTGPQLILNTHIQEGRMRRRTSAYEALKREHNASKSCCTVLLWPKTREPDKVHDRNNRGSLSVISDNTKSI